MKVLIAVIAALVATVQGGYVAPYATGVAAYTTGLYGSYGAYDAAHYGYPGFYNYWGHNPTVVQENSAGYGYPYHTGYSYPYSGLYGAHGQKTVIQANVAKADHWGYPAVYGAGIYGNGYGYDKYLAAPATKYLL